MTKDEALKMALEAFDRSRNTAMIFAIKARIPECGEFAGIAQDLDWAIAAIKEARAQQQEPVGEVLDERGAVDWLSFVPPAGTPLYTASQAKPWVGLTDDDLHVFASQQHGWEDLCFAVEAKLKEKNT